MASSEKDTVGQHAFGRMLQKFSSAARWLRQGFYHGLSDGVPRCTVIAQLVGLRKHHTFREVQAEHSQQVSCM
jgi:hypothetical protein